MATIRVCVHNVPMTDPQLVADAVRELYGSPAAGFVELRTAWVRRARAAKDREAAATIGALRKPTRSADLLNRLARAEPTAIDDLLRLGADLRRAQRTADAPRLRELTARRRELVGELLRLLSRIGGDVTPTVRDEVVATLGAALVDDDVALGLRSGTLTTAGSWDGFGPDVSAQLSVVRPAADASDAASSGTADEADESDDDESEAARAGAADDEPAAAARSHLRLVPDEAPAEPAPGNEEAEAEQDPEPSDRQLRDLARAEARRQVREEEQSRREAARGELDSLEERRAAQRAQRAEQARADARRRLDQATSALDLAREALDDLDAEIGRVTRQLENLRQDRDDQAELTDRAERAMTRATEELERVTPDDS